MTSTADVKDVLGGSLVRILDPDRGEVVSAGVVVAEGLVVTCAHVVNAALGRPRDCADRPTEPVLVDVPFSPDDRQVKARVVNWAPVDERGGGDIAILEVLEMLPTSCAPVALVEVRNAMQHPFQTLGFPRGFSEGVVATGTLVGRNTAGWVQMEASHQPGPRVREGFSGSPVWDEAVRGIVGIVVTASDIEEEKTAFLIPAEAVHRLMQSAADIPGQITVLPPSVDLGVVTAAAGIDAMVWVDSQGKPFTARLSPPTGFYVLDTREDGVAVRPDPAESGERSVTLVIETDSDCREIPVEATTTAAEKVVLRQWVTWPGDEAVRRALQDWATSHALVPDALFDGDLEIDECPVVRVRVRHVDEERDCERRTAPDAPDTSDTFTGSVEELCVHFDAMAEQSWEGMVEDSLTEIVCRECDDQHRTFCTGCKGRGKVTCARQLTCSDCKGSGKRFENQVSVACATCSGRGQVTCPLCAGAGFRECDSCSDGKVPCPHCGGDGIYFSYLWGVVSRSIRTRSYTTVWEESDLPLTDADFLPLAVAGSDRVGLLPEQYRDDVSTWLETETAGWEQGEVQRDITLAVAPAITIAYRRGKHMSKALLVNGRVHAPGARTPGWWQVKERFGSKRARA